MFYIKYLEYLAVDHSRCCLSMLTLYSRFVCSCVRVRMEKDEMMWWKKVKQMFECVTLTSLTLIRPNPSYSFVMCFLKESLHIIPMTIVFFEIN